MIQHGIIAFDFALYSGSAQHHILRWDTSLSGAPFILPLAGNLSVCIFFVLSGYVLSQSFSYTSLGPLGLLAKRYVRFTLPILTVCLLSYAVMAAGMTWNHGLAAVSKSTWLADQFQQTPSLLTALREGGYGALISGRPFSASYDSSLWTMSIEFYGSIVMIAVFSLTARSEVSKRMLHRKWSFALLCVVGYGSYLGLFAAGALLNLTQAHQRIGPKTAGLLLCIGLFLGTIPYSSDPWTVVKPFMQYHFHALVRGLPYGLSALAFDHAVGAVMIVVAANSLPRFQHMLSSAPFRFLGHISFPLYLVHIPLLMSMVSGIALALMAASFSYPATMALGLAVHIILAMAAATLLFVVNERPSIILAGCFGKWVDRAIRKDFWVPKKVAPIVGENGPR